MDAGPDGGEGEAVVEVDVGDEGHGGAAHDLRQGGGGRLVGYGDADDLGAEAGQLGDLFEGGLRVGGVGVGHRLDDDGGVAADLDIADVDGAGAAPGAEREVPFDSAQDRPFEGHLNRLSPLMMRMTSK